jgi:hypothetical protein
MKQPTPRFFAKTSKNGKLNFDKFEREGLKRWVQSFPEDSKVDIVIRKHSEKRTNRQNRYYFGVVLPILADHFGHDNVEDMHEDLKEKFNPVSSLITPGKMIGGSTTNLSTIEFFGEDTSYVERICRWASMEYSIYIPPPKKAKGD